MLVENFFLSVRTADLSNAGAGCLRTKSDDVFPHWKPMDSGVER